MQSAYFVQGSQIPAPHPTTSAPPVPSAQRSRRKAVTPRKRSAGGIFSAASTTGRVITTRSGSRTPAQMLLVELVIGGVIIGIRMLANYEIQQDGTVRGKIAHPRGEYGPFTVAAGLIGTFFLLSFGAAKGGRAAKVSVLAGLMVILVLGMKSLEEMQAVTSIVQASMKGSSQIVLTSYTGNANLLAMQSYTPAAGILTGDAFGGPAFDITGSSAQTQNA